MGEARLHGAWATAVQRPSGGLLARVYVHAGSHVVLEANAPTWEVFRGWPIRAAGIRGEASFCGVNGQLVGQCCTVGLFLSASAALVSDGSSRANYSTTQCQGFDSISASIGSHSASRLVTIHHFVRYCVGDASGALAAPTAPCPTPDPKPYSISTAGPSIWRTVFMYAVTLQCNYSLESSHPTYTRPVVAPQRDYCIQLNREGHQAWAVHCAQAGQGLRPWVHGPDCCHCQQRC